MSREHSRLPMHGRDHVPGGSDPIPGLENIGGAALAHKSAKYQMPLPGSVTAAPGFSAVLAWNLREGDAILDTTVPATPVVTIAGQYATTVVFSSTTPVWTVGACIQGVLEYHLGAWAGNRLIDTRDKTPAGANNLPSGGDIDVPRGVVTLVGWLEPGDSITFQIDNLDNDNRDLTVDAAHVSLLYLTTA